MENLPNTSQTAELLSFQLRTLHNDVTDMRRAVNEMSKGINQLQLIEERQAQAAKAMERISQSLERMENRVTTLETKSPASDRAVGWIDKALLALAGAAFMYFLKAMGVVS